MSNLTHFQRAAAPVLLSLLRIVAAFIFMQHGAMKLFGFPAPMGFEAHLNSQLGLAAILELVGGGLVLIGLFTRPVAFILAGEMAVAYFQVHFPQSFWPVVNHGEAAALYCFIFLYLAAAGAGTLSLDRLVASRKEANAQTGTVT